MPFFGVPIRNGLPIGLGSVAGFGVQQFDPSQLFAGGTVAGAWYDPSDLSTMFTTSAGTTPVAMPGLGSAVSVGLMLDKSQGLVLGPELVDTANTAAAWTAYANNTVTNDDGGIRVTYVDNANGAYLYFSATGGLTTNLVVGRRYQVTAEARVSAAGNVSINGNTGLGTGVTFATITSTTYVSVSFSFIAGSTALDLINTGGMGAGESIWIRNISVKEISGNHAISFNNTTARPELRARVNQLLNSENFSGAAWTVDGISLTASAGTAPDGTNTATSAVLGTGGNRVYQFDNTGVLGNKIFSIYVKPNAGSTITITAVGGMSPNSAAAINASTGVVTGFAGASSVPVGNGWYRVFLPVSVNTASGNGTYWVISGPASSVFIWGAQLVSTNAFPANTYQRIADANTYDTAGFPLYLRFDGIDDSMYTPANLNLSGTDKVAVFAGVRKLSDAAAGMLAEFSTDAFANGKAFYFYQPSASYNVNSTGTAQNVRSYSPGAAPLTSVLAASLTTVAVDSASAVSTRINGVFNAGTSVASNSSTGNYGTYPLYVGARNNSGLWFNGQVYGLLVVGSAVSAGNISATEQWVAGKTGLVIP